MSMHRRGFFGSLLGLFGLGWGLGGIAKAEKLEQQGRWTEDHTKEICRQLRLHGVAGMESANAMYSMQVLIQRVGDQMEQTGLGLIWKVPNMWGRTCELHCIPTEVAIPNPAIPDYPDGYYRIAPIYPFQGYGFYNKWLLSCGNALIPAQQIIRCQARNKNLRYNGYSPLTAMRLRMEEAEAMDRMRWLSFQRSIEPLDVLE